MKMFPKSYPERPVPKPKRESDDCEIEIKNTKQGKRIRFRGKCSREQIRVLARENGIDMEED